MVSRQRDVLPSFRTLIAAKGPRFWSHFQAAIGATNNVAKIEAFLAAIGVRSALPRNWRKMVHNSGDILAKSWATRQRARWPSFLKLIAVMGPLFMEAFQGRKRIDLKCGKIGRP